MSRRYRRYRRYRRHRRYSRYPSDDRVETAAASVAKLEREGYVFRPVRPATARGKIASTFWGRAWCDNLEAYSDYQNRLPRGRTYLRRQAVVDLGVATGEIEGLVYGRDLYAVRIEVAPLDPARWKAIADRCAGAVESLIALLDGRLSDAVMAVVTDHDAGMFPSPDEISLSCSCPDWAVMCKHVAATMYGVGARLDADPASLFTLRGVDPSALITGVSNQHFAGDQNADTLPEEADLASIFGVELEFDIDLPNADDTELQARVYRVVCEQPGLGAAELADWLDVPLAEAREVAQELCEAGTLAHRDDGYWPV